MKATVFSSYVLLSLLTYSYGGEIINSPSSETVNPGQFANFTCTVGCTDYIEWFIEGYAALITTDCSQTQFGLMVCKEQPETCSNEGYVETLHVMVAELEGAATRIAVQCVSISAMLDPSQEDCIPYHAFSRFALLSVEEPAATELPSEPTPSEPTPTPVVCPSPTTVEVTVATTVIEREFFTTTSTVTTTVTEILLVTETPTIFTTSRASGPRRSGLSVILSELLTWFCTLFAGILFL